MRQPSGPAPSAKSLNFWAFLRLSGQLGRPSPNQELLLALEHQFLALVEHR